MDISTVISGSKRVDRGEVKLHPFTLYQQQVISLDCGMEIKIEDLYQYHTYGGMLCGIPMAHTHPFQFENAIRIAKRVLPHLLVEKAVIFPPVISTGRTLQKISRDGDTRMVDWEVLPKITTIAALQKTTSFDTVLAIWWQDELGYPDADLIISIKGLDWQINAVELDP